MATIDVYKIKIEVDGDQDVKKLQNNVDELSSTLDNAGKAIAGFGLAATAAFAGLATSAVQLADELVDVADGLGLTVGRVYQVGLAAERSGGQFDSAGKMLQKFALSIDMAAKGSQDMQDDFAKAGVSLQDLATLSDEALFDKVAQGIAAMGASADSTAVAMKLLGKSAATINFDTFNQEFKLSAEEAQQAQQAMYMTAEAVGALEIVFRRFQIAALEVLLPIIKQIRNISVETETVKTAFKILGSVMAAAVGAAVVTKIVTIITAIVQLTKALRGAAVAGAILQGVTGVGLAKVIGGLVGAGGALAVMNSLFDESAENVEGMTDAIKAAESAEEGITKQRQIQAGADAKKLDTLISSTKQLELQVKQADELRRLTINLIGQETAYGNVIKANRQLELDAQNKISDLDNQIRQIRNEGASNMVDQVAELEKQKQIIIENVTNTKLLNQLEYQRTAQLKAQQATLLYGQSLQRLQIEQELFDEQIKNLGLIGDAAEDASKKLSLKEGLEAGILNARSTIDTIGAELRNRLGEKAGKEASDALRAEFEKGIVAVRDSSTSLKDLTFGPDQTYFADAISYAQTSLGLTEEQVAQLYLMATQLEAIESSYDQNIRNVDKFREAQDKLSESFKLGAATALDSIASSMSNFQLAQNAVLTAWGHIGSAIDNFVETGKLSFKDLARSIIADLTKMILKAMIFKYIFEPIMGSLGLPIPGRANGGPVAGGQAYMVGERGPELFVPKGPGQIIPNNQLGTASTGTGVVNAPVTNNYITNQISAVDAKSVAQLFVENRQLLLGSVQMAQKELP